MRFRVTSGSRIQRFFTTSKPKLVPPLSRLQIRKDIEQIYSLGQFKDIQVETRTELDGLKVIFRVVEIASIGNVSIAGNDKIDSDDIWEKIPIKRGATFQEHMVQESIEEITHLYQEMEIFQGRPD